MHEEPNKNGKWCQRGADFTCPYNSGYLKNSWRSGESGTQAYWAGFRMACPAKCN